MFRKLCQSSLASLPWLTAMLVPLSSAHAAGNTATNSGATNATIVAPIVLTHTTGAALNFGKFLTATGGGTMAITPLGGQTASGAVTIVSGGAPAADAFTVSGGASRTFTINVSSGTVSNGGTTPTTMAFTTTASATTGTMSATGTASFTVGGTLTSIGTEPSGTYNGSYSVTVAYN